MKVYAYLRVSTYKQDLDTQREEVLKYCKYRGHEVVRIFEDIASGKDTNRKAFNEMIDLLQSNPQGIESLVIWKLDRIGRSIRDLIRISDFLQKQNVGMIAITSNIDTTTKEGRLFFYMMGAFSEYERELTMERTQVAIEAARNSGKVCHRPKKTLDITAIKTLQAQGVPISEIARQMKVSRKTIYGRLK